MPSSELFRYYTYNWCTDVSCRQTTHMHKKIKWKYKCTLWTKIIAHALSRLRQRDCHEFKASLDYKVRSCFKKPKTATKNQNTDVYMMFSICIIIRNCQHKFSSCIFIKTSDYFIIVIPKCGNTWSKHMYILMLLINTENVFLQEDYTNFHSHNLPLHTFFFYKKTKHFPIFNIRQKWWLTFIEKLLH